MESGPRLCDSLKSGHFHSVSIAVSYVHIAVTKHPRETGENQIMLSRAFRGLVKAGTAGCL